VVVPVIVIGRRVRNLSRTSQDTLAAVGSYAGEALRSIKVVQSFNHEQLDIDAFQRRVDIAFRVAVRRIRQRSWLVALVMMLVLGAIATMLWVGGQDVIAQRISPGELAAFIFYAFIVAGSVGAISEVYTDLQRAAGATERLVELLNSPSELPEADQPQTLTSRSQANVTAAAVGRLAVANLSFAYPSRPQNMVLQNLTFTVSPGEMIAIVGPSGAGKSTLFDLMQRFYDPDSGQILLDGVDIRDLRLADVRERVGFVPQDSVLFAGTLEDNLRYGAPEASREELVAALQQAHATEFVEALPDGLATVVGEGGVGLSGGQKQRMAIARALLTKPEILLLDEATSALDAQSEAHIRSTISELKGSCSIVVIAHRLSTVREADRILVVADGQLEASGAHDELLGTSELYAKFARIQFAAEVQPVSDVRTTAG
jgi:ATP-binding cassette subfamily B protein